MAPTKKAAKKATASKKAVKKTAASKKATTASKKAVKKTAVSKKEVKATKTTKVDKVSTQKADSDSNWKMFAIIAGIIVVVLGLGLFATMYMNSPSSDDMKTNSSAMSNSTGPITLTVVEDPTCTSCQVDAFTQQVKSNLIPDLVIKKIDSTSDEGKKILSDLNLIQVPAYLFSKNIDQRDDWSSQLASAFNAVSVNGESEYLLNPQYVPTKVLTSAPIITNTSAKYGNPDAPVTIVEFSDYECPFCGIAEGNKDLVAQFQAQSPGYVPPMPEVYKNYVDTGKVNIVFYNMPLLQLHPKVMPAHLASLCANEQGKWKEFHDILFADRSNWTAAPDYTVAMKEYAVQLGLNTTQFNDCLDSQKYLSQIQAEEKIGQEYGVSGTPAFIIGKTFLSGAQDYSTFKAAIDAELNKTQ